jgi:predicted ATPase with chaperone activity
MRVAAAVDTTRSPRVAGRTDGRTALVTGRPCRAPHQAISAVGRIGGGQVPLPGEVSRAHHCILLWDTLPKCRRHVLEVLRQAFEKSSTAIIARVCSIRWQGCVRHMGGTGADGLACVSLGCAPGPAFWT